MRNRRHVVAEERFVVAFDGPALMDHTMPVRDLAGALLSMSDAFQQAQHVLNPGASPATLSVRAVEPGSFEVVMVLIEPGGPLGEAMDFLLGRPVLAGVTLAGIVRTVWGTVGAIKNLRGRKIKSTRETTPGMTELIASDGFTLTVPTEQVHLIRDVEFRHRVTEIMQPLHAEGVTVFRVSDTQVGLEVTDNDLAAFAPPDLPAEEELGVDRREALLQAVGIEFDGRKWRFTEGGGTAFSASIEDLRFRGQIERQEITFGKNDLLRVELRTRQYRDPAGKLKAEHAIERVLHHIDGGRQLPLDLGE